MYGDGKDPKKVSAALRKANQYAAETKRARINIAVRSKHDAIRKAAQDVENATHTVAESKALTEELRGKLEAYKKVEQGKSAQKPFLSSFTSPLRNIYMRMNPQNAVATLLARKMKESKASGKSSRNGGISNKQPFLESFKRQAASAAAARGSRGSKQVATARAIVAR